MHSGVHFPLDWRSQCGNDFPRGVRHFRTDAVSWNQRHRLVGCIARQWHIGHESASSGLKTTHVRHCASMASARVRLGSDQSDSTADEDSSAATPCTSSWPMRLRQMTEHLRGAASPPFVYSLLHSTDFPTAFAPRSSAFCISRPTTVVAFSACSVFAHNLSQHGSGLLQE